MEAKKNGRKTLQRLLQRHAMHSFLYFMTQLVPHIAANFRVPRVLIRDNMYYAAAILPLLPHACSDHPLSLKFLSSYNAEVFN